MNRIHKFSLVGYVLFVVLCFGCGGGGGGNGGGGGGQTCTSVNPCCSTSSSGTTCTFSQVISNISMSCIAIPGQNGAVTPIVCATDAAGMDTSALNNFGNQIIPTVLGLTQCAQNLGYNLGHIVEQPSENVPNNVDDENGGAELQAIEMVLATTAEVMVICNNPNAAGCHFSFIDASTIVVPVDNPDVLAIFTHEAGHVLEEQLLGCETHDFGSIAEECGRCDCQYGTIQAGACGPSQEPTVVFPGVVTNLCPVCP